MKLSRETIVGSKKIGLNHPPFIVAEMSGSHNGSIERALAIVDAAAKAGAHALKIQTYTADTMTLDIKDREFFIDDPKSLWFGKSLYDLYDEAHTPWAWHKAIFDRCREYGMIGFSAPFDDTAVDFLESLNAPIYKIASFESQDSQLLRKVAKTGKPVIVSTGMSDLEEIGFTVKTLRAAGCEQIILLKCTSSYPAPPHSSNIKTIEALRSVFHCEVGLSDHTMGIGVAIAAVAIGATVIEKHFTLDRSEGGVDSAFSLEPQELKLLVEESEKAWQGLGEVTLHRHEVEKNSLTFRRSLYITQDLKLGDVLSPKNVRSIRPGNGLAPKWMDVVIGRRVTKDISKGTPLDWSILS